MENVLGHLYVGNDTDYERVSGKQGWSILRCCKEGPGGHRNTLGYTTKAAPQGKNYLYSEKGNHRALNFIDPHDPNFVPMEMIEKGLEYIDERLNAGDKVLVACNAGHSRGPTTAMLYLRSVGELPGNFASSERVFSTLYPNYDPGIGIRQFARTHWEYFNNSLRKDK